MNFSFSIIIFLIQKKSTQFCFQIQNFVELLNIITNLSENISSLTNQASSLLQQNNKMNLPFNILNSSSNKTPSPYFQSKTIYYTQSATLMVRANNQHQHVNEKKIQPIKHNNIDIINQRRVQPNNHSINLNQSYQMSKKQAPPQYQQVSQHHQNTILSSQKCIRQLTCPLSEKESKIIQALRSNEYLQKRIKQKQLQNDQIQKILISITENSQQLIQENKKLLKQINSLTKQLQNSQQQRVNNFSKYQIQNKEIQNLLKAANNKNKIQQFKLTLLNQQIITLKQKNQKLSQKYSKLKTINQQQAKQIQDLQKYLSQIQNSYKAKEIEFVEKIKILTHQLNQQKLLRKKQRQNSIQNAKFSHDIIDSFKHDANNIIREIAIIQQKFFQKTIKNYQGKLLNQEKCNELLVKLQEKMKQFPQLLQNFKISEYILSLVKQSFPAKFEHLCRLSQQIIEYFDQFVKKLTDEYIQKSMSKQEDHWIYKLIYHLERITEKLKDFILKLEHHLSINTANIPQLVTFIEKLKNQIKPQKELQNMNWIKLQSEYKLKEVELIESKQKIIQLTNELNKQKQLRENQKQGYLNALRKYESQKSISQSKIINLHSFYKQQNMHLVNKLKQTKKTSTTFELQDISLINSMNQLSQNEANYEQNRNRNSKSTHSQYKKSNQQQQLLLKYIKDQQSILISQQVQNFTQQINSFINYKIQDDNQYLSEDLIESKNNYNLIQVLKKIINKPNQNYQFQKLKCKLQNAVKKLIQYLLMQTITKQKQNQQKVRKQNLESVLTQNTLPKNKKKLIQQKSNKQINTKINQPENQLKQHKYRQSPSSSKQSKRINKPQQCKQQGLKQSTQKPNKSNHILKSQQKQRNSSKNKKIQQKKGSNESYMRWQKFNEQKYNRFKRSITIQNHKIKNLKGQVSVAVKNTGSLEKIFKKIKK